jgi:hypothetical protein
VVVTGVADRRRMKSGFVVGLKKACLEALMVCGKRDDFGWFAEKGMILAETK